MTNNYFITLDRRRDGQPVKTKEGYYRFSLSFGLGTDYAMATVKGFRYNSTLRKVIPPSIKLDRGVYQIVELAPELEQDIREQFEEQLAIAK